MIIFLKFFACSILFYAFAMLTAKPEPQTISINFKADLTLFSKS